MRRILPLVGCAVILALSGCDRAAEDQGSTPTAAAAAEYAGPSMGRQAFLDKYAGKYPGDSYFWADPWVLELMQRQLGSRFEVLLGAAEITSAVREKDGVLYLTGSNARDRTYAAVFALDSNSWSAYVKLRERGVDTEYPASGPEFSLPEDLVNFANNWSYWKESVALQNGTYGVSDQPVRGSVLHPSDDDGLLLPE